MSPEFGGDKATTADILQSFAVMRAHGVRFYESFMSIQELADTSAVCGATVPVRHRVLGPRGFVAAGVLATLADEALASALMSAIGEPSRLATIGLMVQVVRETPATQIQAEAEVVSLARRTGVARCKMTDERGNIAAIATGTFTIRRVKTGDPRLFAEQGDATGDSRLQPVPLHDLTQQERSIFQHMERGFGATSQDGPFADYLGIEWNRRGDGESSGRWPLGPHIWNSTGAVHGGSICGALGVAALACIPGDPPGRILEQHVQFVRPGHGDELHVEAHLLRQGQSVIFVHAAITDVSQKNIASALVTVRGTRPAR